MVVLTLSMASSTPHKCFTSKYVLYYLAVRTSWSRHRSLSLASQSSTILRVAPQWLYQLVSAPLFVTGLTVKYNYCRFILACLQYSRLATCPSRVNHHWTAPAWGQSPTSTNSGGGSSRAKHVFMETRRRYCLWRQLRQVFLWLSFGYTLWFPVGLHAVSAKATASYYGFYHGFLCNLSALTAQQPPASDYLFSSIVGLRLGSWRSHCYCQHWLWICWHQTHAW